MTTAPHNCREEADRFRPTYAQLRAEGPSQDVITAIYRVRDMHHAGRSAWDIAAWLAYFGQQKAVRASDVWPEGVPGHWAVCATCGQCRDDCAFEGRCVPGVTCDCETVDGAPDTQEQVTTPPEVYA